MIDPQPHGFQYFWQLVIGGPVGIMSLVAFIFREKLAEIFKGKTEEQAITRAEFEPRMSAMTDEIHFIHGDLSDKLMAHAAQARQDSRDNRDWIDKKLDQQWEKLDSLTNQILLNQKSK